MNVNIDIEWMWCVIPSSLAVKGKWLERFHSRLGEEMDLGKLKRE